MTTTTAGTISVFLADDNLIVREGVRTLLSLEQDIEVVGVAGDYEELVQGADAAAPHVLVSDIRMPPTFQREGIEAAKELRKRHPGTGVVILSQYDDPEYAISLLAEGSAGYAYLLKDRVAEGDQLARAVRAVAGGGSMLDPAIVDALVHPVADRGDLSPADDELLRLLAEGRPIKAIAAARRTTAAAVSDDVERLFLQLARDASAGAAGALRRLRMLHQAIVEREEQGEALSRLLPTGVADKIQREGGRLGETETVTVTVLMSDIRGYSGIAERTEPTRLAAQLNTHRAEMNHAILAEGGTVMQFVGDAVMAVFGAPLPQDDHAERALAAARSMHRRQDAVNRQWTAAGLPPFGLGIGLSTGDVAAALRGSE
ncbi:MAG TPA: response regulator, partial [Acidimicrobiales bacterium]|nr:response regulator [Acidimicrobiales bacterium]